MLTDLQKQVCKCPNRLEYLRELDKREALKGQDELKQEFVRLETGVLGEQAVLDYLEKFGNENWIILKNVWLNHYGQFEIDILLITLTGIYIFEVKNYAGKFEYKDNQCFINGEPTGNNIIAQGQRAVTKLEKILKESSFYPKVRGAIVFTGEHCTIDIQDEVSGVDVFMSNELRNYIWKITQDDYNYYGEPINVDRLLRIISKAESTNQFKSSEIPPEIISNTKKGIRCSKCGKFGLEVGRKYISCKCGMHENRDEAIVRTICEYGVLHYQEDLTTTELTDFFGGEVARNSVLIRLDNHFDKIGNNRSTKYRNKCLPFKKIYNELDLNKPNFIRLDCPI